MLKLWSHPSFRPNETYGQPASHPFKQRRRYESLQSQGSDLIDGIPETVRALQQKTQLQIQFRSNHDLHYHPSFIGCPCISIANPIWQIHIKQLYSIIIIHHINNYTIWLVVYLPLWKIWVPQLGLLFPTEWTVIKAMFQTTNQL